MLDNWQLAVLLQSGGCEFKPRGVHDNLSAHLWVYMRFPVPEHQNYTNKYMYVFMYVCIQQRHVYRQSQVRKPNGILHTAEEDNLSPFDSKITCLCHSIEINNNNIYVLSYLLISIYRYRSLTTIIYMFYLITTLIYEYQFGLFYVYVFTYLLLYLLILIFTGKLRWSIL